MQAFTCVCLCSVCAFTGDTKAICVCLHLAFEKTPVARSRTCSTPAFSRRLRGSECCLSQLIGNVAIVRKRSIIHKKVTCVWLRLPVAASFSEAQERKGDMWPALGNMGVNELAPKFWSRVCVILTRISRSRDLQSNLLC